MAENRIEILVTSKNDTKAGFESAKRDAERAGDDAGHGFESKFASRLSSGISSALTSFGGALSNLPLIGGLIPEAAGSNPYAAAGVIAGVTAAAAGLLVEIDGLVSGFAAATLGVGAFGLFAIPTFKQVASDASGLVNLWDALQTAQNKLAVAQQNFQADPTKASQAALTAAQRALVTAQTNLRAAQMGLGQDAGTAATGVLQLRDAYNKLSTALQPLTYKVLSDALTAATTFLPNLAPFAKAGGDAIDGLLKHVNEFFQSADFKKWLDKMLPIVGPAITAIGQGIGKVVVAVGNLFTRMSKSDDIKSIELAFTVIAGAIDVVGRTVQILDATFKIATREIVGWIGGVLDAATRAFGWIPGLGPILKRADQEFHQWSDNIIGYMNGIEGAASQLTGAIAGIVGAITKLPASDFGPGLFPTGPSSGKLGVLSGGPAAQSATRLQLEVVSGGSTDFENFMVEAMKKWVRVRGGGGPKSVQIALGQTH